MRAVISRVWPRDLFGSGEDGEQNWRLLMTKVDAFIFARRYETISLDSVMSGMKVRTISTAGTMETDYCCRLRA